MFKWEFYIRVTEELFSSLWLSKILLSGNWQIIQHKTCLSCMWNMKLAEDWYFQLIISSSKIQRLQDKEPKICHSKAIFFLVQLVIVLSQCVTETGCYCKETTAILLTCTLLFLKNSIDWGWLRFLFILPWTASRFCNGGWGSSNRAAQVAAPLLPASTTLPPLHWIRQTVLWKK